MDEIPSEKFSALCLTKDELLDSCSHLPSDSMSFVPDEERKKFLRKLLQTSAYVLERLLKGLFLKSLSSNDTEDLVYVFQTDIAISMKAEVEKLFAEAIVKPYMECHITYENILKYGLSYVYDKILQFIRTSPVLDAAREAKRRGSTDIVPGYDFLVNSVFPEIVYCFDFIIPVHIYAHGNPEKFHKNYTSTMLFLDQLEDVMNCHDQASFQRLRNTESFERFRNKWKLDDYFKIISSEVTGKFEQSILRGFVYSKDLKLGERDDSYLLNISKTLSECMNRCYNEQVFLKPLSCRIFCLNLKLLSRFKKSACSYLKSVDEEFIKENLVDAAVIIKDVEMLKTEFTKLFAEKISVTVPIKLVGDAFTESMRMLIDVLYLANSVMIKALVKQCYSHLREFYDFPRLAIITNREVPSKPSSYVVLVFNILTKFISKTDSILPVDSKKYCLEQVMDEIIVQCVAMIRRVLDEIKKLEQSFKNCKRAEDTRKTAIELIDIDKIILQLIIDITAIEKKVSELQLDIDHFVSYRELTDLKKTADKMLAHTFLIYLK